MVSPETCKEQLLYEIQGTYYLNGDVTAVIEDAKLEQVGKNRVQLSGITGRPPPYTTKCGLTAFGGYQAEVHWAMVGLDIPEKVKLLKSQLRHAFGKARLAKLAYWDVTAYGSSPENARNQNAATVDVRLIAQSRNIEDLSEENFLSPALNMNMHTYPAATFHTDLRTAVPKEVSRLHAFEDIYLTNSAVHGVLPDTYSTAYTNGTLLEPKALNFNHSASKEDYCSSSVSAIL